MQSGPQAPETAVRQPSLSWDCLLSSGFLQRPWSLPLGVYLQAVTPVISTASHWSFGKFKSKPQGDSTSHRWPLLRKNKMWARMWREWKPRALLVGAVRKTVW